MTARLTSRPSLGNETAGVRFTDSRRINSELVRIHRVSGWENAPIVPMDEPSGAVGWIGSAGAVALFVGAVLALVYAPWIAAWVRGAGL